MPGSQQHRFNLSRWALEHQSIVRYLIAVLLLGGIFSYLQLGQDEDPPFTFRAMVVRAYWPGASAEQTIEQVTDRIERALQTVPYADKIRSYAKPGETLTILQLEEGAPVSAVADSWYQARKKVSDIQGTFPAGTVGPFFNDEFGDTFGVIFSFSSDGFNYAELKKYVEDVRQQLLRVQDVAKVELFGVQDEKVYIEIPQRKLAQYGISLEGVSTQLTGQNAIEPSGVLVLPDERLWVRVTGQIANVEGLRNLPIRVAASAQSAAGVSAGGTVRLGDIATVERGYVDPPTSKMRHGTAAGSQEVIGLGVSMVKGGDIVGLGERLAEVERRINASLPVGIEMVKTADQPSAVKESVGEFVHVLIEAVVIVLAVSFLALGLHTRPLRLDVRPGLVVALTIPLVLAATFLCMYIFNINLHKISLGALIIALGLLVDDAIIAVEMMVRKMEEGMDRLDAATFAYQSTAFPMLTGTLITVAGFLPIAMAKSSAGEYTFSIFAVTAIALILSWIAAVIFTPYIGFLLLRIKPQHTADGNGGDAGATHPNGHDVFDTRFYRGLRRLVDACLRFRWIVIGITAAMLALGAASFSVIEQQFFPESNRPELTVDLWLPEGASFQATEAEALKLEKWLSAQPEVSSYLTYIGVGSPRFYLPLDLQLNQVNLAQVVVTSRGLADRDALRARLQTLFDNDFPNVRGRVKLLSSGPPVPYDVQFRVQGTDIEGVRRIADQVKEIVRGNPNVVGVNDNWNENIKVLRLEIDQDKARALGVTSQNLQRTAQLLLTGATIGTFREENKLIDIVVRQPADERAAMTRLAEASVPTTSGRYVPLSQIATPHLVWEPGVIWRQNRDYAITVQSDVRHGIQGPTVTAQIDPKLADLRRTLPAGYEIAVAGATEESGTAQSSIVANVPLMLVLVMTLLMAQLHSLSRAVLVYLTGPLGIIGAALALLLFKAPFGFVAQLGVIALLGMIIRNSVILIDQIEQHVKEGEAVWTAIVESAVRRSRPIMLTAAAAVLAMIPLSRSTFWGPMAVAIMGGLIVATFLTLLFLPALYAACFRVKRPDAPRSA
jgi:multidrug efflux pump subunit AcrB